MEKNKKKKEERTREREKTLSGRKVENSIVRRGNEARRSYSPMYNKI